MRPPTAKKLSRRDLERVLGAGVPQTVGQLAHNDAVTQQRILKLEERVGDVESVYLAPVDERVLLSSEIWRLRTGIKELRAEAKDFKAMSFWQRLRWFVRGEQ